MVSAGIRLFLPGQNSPARPLVGRLTQRCVVLPGDAFDVVSSAHFGLYEAGLGQRWGCTLGQRQNGARAVCNVWIDLKVGPVLGVCSLPLHLVPFKLTAVADKRRFGCQRQHLGLLAGPVVVHALRVFGVTHEAADVQPPLNLELVAHAADHRDVSAGPVRALQHLVTVDFEPLDLLAVCLARLERLAKLHPQHLVLGRALERGDVAGVQVERFFGVLDVEILGDTHRVFVHPLAKALVAHAQRLQRGDRRGVRVLALVLVTRDVLGDEAPAGV